MNATSSAPVENLRIVADLGDEFALVSQDQDIAATLADIGCSDRAGEVGCLFVEARDGEILAVFACSRSIPWLEAPVFRLL